jgi:hypothetical protein
LYNALSATIRRLSGIRIVTPCRESAVATPTFALTRSAPSGLASCVIWRPSIAD